MSDEKHVMTRLFCKDGFEHWICFQCGRYLLIHWSPWHKEVLEEGDETVSHTGGMTMGNVK